MCGVQGSEDIYSFDEFKKHGFRSEEEVLKTTVVQRWIDAGAKDKGRRDKAIAAFIKDNLITLGGQGVKATLKLAPTPASGVIAVTRQVPVDRRAAVPPQQGEPSLPPVANFSAAQPPCQEQPSLGDIYSFDEFKKHGFRSEEEVLKTTVVQRWIDAGAKDKGRRDKAIAAFIKDNLITLGGQGVKVTLKLAPTPASGVIAVTRQVPVDRRAAVPPQQGEPSLPPVANFSAAQPPCQEQPSLGDIYSFDEFKKHGFRSEEEVLKTTVVQRWIDAGAKDKGRRDKAIAAFIKDNLITLGDQGVKVTLKLCKPLSAEAKEKLIKQVNYYFSNVNLVRDDFLLRKIAENPEGFVSAACLLTFNRVEAITHSDVQLISALKDSPKLVVDEKAMAVRRKAPMPERKGTDKTTIYATPIERSTQDELQEFFGKFGEVLDVGRYYPSVSIVYSTAEEADAAKNAQPMYGGVQLVIEKKEEYMARKAAETPGSSKKPQPEVPPAVASSKPPLLGASRAITDVQYRETMVEADSGPRLRVHRHVLERVAAFITVPQQACARRASKALWEAVRAESMENLLRATVLEHRDTSNVDAQLVFVAMSRAVKPSKSGDTLVENALQDWSGGLTQLYEELQQRFPRAAAIGVPARLAAIRPFPFASGSTVTTMCILFSLPRHEEEMCWTSSSTPPAHAVESVVLEVRNPSVLVRALSHDGAACPILCLDGVTPEHFPHMLDGVSLSSLLPIRCIAPSAFLQCKSLRSVCLTNLPLLESIGDYAFSECDLSVDHSELPSLRSIGKYAFHRCFHDPLLTIKNLPQLESIGDYAFYATLAWNVNLSDLPSLRSIGECAFQYGHSVRSLTLTNLPLLESIGDYAFSKCPCLLKVNLSDLPSLRSIGKYAFHDCAHVQWLTIANLPRLESIGDYAFYECWLELDRVNLSDLPSLRSIGKQAFRQCLSVRSLTLANLPLLESIGEDAFGQVERLSKVDFSGLASLRIVRADDFRGSANIYDVSLVNLQLLENIGDYFLAGRMHLTRVDLSQLPSLRSIERNAFHGCPSLQSITLTNLPLLENIGEDAFAECVHLTTLDLSRLPSLRIVRACAFRRCTSLQSVSLVNLQLLEHIDDEFLAGCEHLSTVDLSHLPSLHSIGRNAFFGCSSLQSVTLANMPVLEIIEEGAFCGCRRLTSVDLSGLPSLRIDRAGFCECSSLQSVNVAMPLLGAEEGPFADFVHLSSVELSRVPFLHAMTEPQERELGRLRAEHEEAKRRLEGYLELERRPLPVEGRGCRRGRRRHKQGRN